MEIELVFRGELADNRVLPGLEGTQSLEGFSRTLTLISHYAVTGQVRQRYPFSEDFRLELVTFEAGSFRTKFKLYFTKEAVRGALVGAGLATVTGPIGNFTTDFLKHVYGELTGHPAATSSPALDSLQDRRTGDLEALREAAVPSARRAHSVIGHGADSITVLGDHNTITVFDRRSKEFLDQSELDDVFEVKLVSVGMFNVNSRYGRVFDYELGKTVSFFVSRDCAERTMGNLGLSLSRYARSRARSQVYIKYSVRRDVAGNPIRYYIRDAWFEGEPGPAS